MLLAVAVLSLAAIFPELCCADETPATRPTIKIATPCRRSALLRRFVSEFVTITPGSNGFPKSFCMGSADGPATQRPVHIVTFGYVFAVAKYEVPQNLYMAVIGSNPSRWKGERNSVEMISRDDAQHFCTVVTRLLHEAKFIAENEEVRLPTEAEWEYCCRAGTQTAYSFGQNAAEPGDQQNQASLLDRFAWHTGNAAGNDPPVGALKPNPWGLHDVHGYLWEYVGDAWHNDYRGAPLDGSAWRANDETHEVVVRGGSWRDPYALLTSSSRKRWRRENKSDDVGLRCVKACADRKTQ